jgi:hypothetical protein
MTEPHDIADVFFPATGTTLPADHGWLLFAALCVVVPGRADVFQAVRHELAMLPTGQQPWSIEVRLGARRILHARAGTVQGHELEVTGLRPQASIVLQAYGLGARRHLGAGVFVAANGGLS